MKADRLPYFLMTAKTLHIGKAAKALNISPSAISHCISALEEELGTKLFEKVGKNIFLTPKGKLLAKRADEVLHTLRCLQEEIQSPEVELEGQVRIGCVHGLLHHWVVPRCSHIYSQFPKLGVELYSLRSAQIVEQVASGTLDFGICFSPTAHPLLAQTVLRQEPLQIAVREEHPILKTKKSTWARALSKIPCATPKAFQGIEVCEDHPALKKAGVTSSTTLTFDSYDVAAKAIQTEDFWALLPACFIEWYGLRSLNLDGFHAVAQVALINLKNRPVSKIQNMFMDFLSS